MSRLRPSSFAKVIPLTTTPFGNHSRRFGWFYIAPALLFFVLFMIFPILYNVVNSFRGQSPTQGIGLSFGNYQAMFNDPIFFTALKNSLVWVVITTLVEMAIGFFCALLIEAYIVRGRSLFRTLLFLPMVVSPSVIAIVFTNLYAPNYGLLFGAFQQLGLASSFPALLGDPNWATIAVICVNIWQWSGFFVLLYSVGISQIDPSLIDAAEVDGATGWARIRHIFLPLVRSTHFSLMILGVIQALQQFPLIYLMTQGGPAESTQVLATYIFTQGYVDNNMPYASALSVVLLLLALAIVGIALTVVRGNFSIGRSDTHA